MASGASFNPRAREGRDFDHPPPRGGGWGFNPRAREGRDVSCRTGEDGYAGFNPRAREGRDIDYIALGDFDRVSIHAPARGATSC